MTTKQAKSKRILSVTIRRMIDEDLDTSWLGEYSNSAETEYAIDRKHSLDCPINTGVTPLSQKTRTAIDAQANTCECADPQCPAHKGTSKCANKANTVLYRVDMEDASGTLMCDDCADDATQSGLFTDCDDSELNDPQCDCEERGDMSGREYRYFNGPVENYKGESPEDIRKYILRDYKRTESLNRGDWCFIGVRADAEVTVNPGEAFAEYGCVQNITSGGLWGIESSDKGTIEDEEKNQLAELKGQLKALGFSSRAIGKAFQNVQHKDS